MKLIFASHNTHKTGEVKKILGSGFELTDLAELGFNDEIIESGLTFEENATIKAKAVWERYKLPVIADDSGLCVTALEGAPGIYSARYAGEKASSSENNKKLLDAMKGITDRTAFFVAVICFINNKGEISYFRGETQGRIIEELKGVTGFGYDPVFEPEGYSQTFAELGEEIKNSISHRYKALKAFKSGIE